MFFKILVVNLSFSLITCRQSFNQGRKHYLVQLKDDHKKPVVQQNNKKINKIGKQDLCMMFDDVKAGLDYNDIGKEPHKAELYLHIYGREDMVFIGKVNLFTRW